MPMSALITKLGPLGVFLLMVPESACIPVPSEVTLLAAGFAVHEGWMPFWAAVAAATAGNIAGSVFAYSLGRLVAARPAPPWMIEALHRCDPLFRTHGARAVFMARLLPLARTFVSLPAGYARLGFGRFVWMTAVGCALWASAFVLGGFLLGNNWRAVSGPIGAPLLLLGASVMVVALRKSR
jgi:membrane protein DedA with SNARE-associated domain